MNVTNHFDIIIVGGGLAGLTAALHLSQTGIETLVIEKQTYPHHKVCGEYVSNEVLPYLQNLGINPSSEGAVKISEFKITNTKGTSISTTLGLGGFGISRFSLDYILYKKALKTASFKFETVTNIVYQNVTNSAASQFTVTTQNLNTYTANYVLGAYGKRSNLDRTLQRSFILNKTPWMAVKAHYRYTMPQNQVALHNFKGGYCGLSKTETDAVNACYLAKVDEFKKFKSIEAFQQKHLSKNPHLNSFFKDATLLFDKPLTISQISFEKKQPIINHIFMLGDSAGLIHPLCGNGMAMAIHSAKIFSELFLSTKENAPIDREMLEIEYVKQWNKTFKSRLKTGNLVQRILLNTYSANLGIRLAKHIPVIIPYIIKKTHGKPLI